MAGTANSGGNGKKTTQALVVAGTFRNDRHGDHESPDPPKGPPEAPKDLTGDALAEWQRMVWRLEVSGTLSKVDDASIYQYACLFAETEQHVVARDEARESVKLLQENLSDLNGADLVQCFQEISKMARLEASYSTQIRQGRMAIRQFLVEFGMTPAARSRVKLPPSKPQSKVDQFRSMKAGA